MSADIEPISGKIPWGAKAAAGDALNRVPNSAPFIALWMEKNANGEEVVKWSKANMDFRAYSFLAVALMEFAQRCVREAMERKDAPPAA